MLKPAVRQGLMTLAAAALVVAVLSLGLLVRLSFGPINGDVLGGAVEKVLAGQVAGGRAKVGHVEIVRFGEANAIGLRMTDVSLDDGKARPVLRARLVETGIGLDSIAMLAPAPSHLVVRDFFAAISASPQGAFELGYDAAGPPPPMRLDTLIFSLTGKARRDRPLSYLRGVDLQNGSVVMREVGGPVTWKAAIDRVIFAKAYGGLSAISRLLIDDGLHHAVITEVATGTVGLKQLTMRGSISDFDPARIFPASGLTRGISGLDAAMEGQARVDYAADRGLTAADITGHAGPGTLRFGDVVQPLDGAQAVTRYDPASKQVVLQSFRLDATRTRLNMIGRLWLVSERKNQPARVEYRLASDHSFLTIAPHAQSQTLDNLTLAGAVVPETGWLEVRDLRVLMAGQPVKITALLYRGRNPNVTWGIKADIAVGGEIGVPQVFAFWPEHVAEGARLWLEPRMQAARVTRASVHADIPPGQIERHKLLNNQLRIAFNYREGVLKVAPTLPAIEHAVGSGVVQGDRLDLVMPSGSLYKLALTNGVVTIPRFKPRGALATFKATAAGDLGDMLTLINMPPLELMGSTGMAPSRLSGPAVLDVVITRPMLFHVQPSDYGATYKGTIRNSTIKDVAIGMDLTGGDMAVEGDLDQVSANGTGRVGPFDGKIAFKAALRGRGAGGKAMDLDGRVSFVGAEGAPFRARVNTRNGTGGGVVRSQVFNGRIDWTPTKVLATGIGRPHAWKQSGLPIGPELPARVPVKLAMAAKGDAWTGNLDADAYSGALAYSAGAARTFRYSAEITPDEARRMGFSQFPLFHRPQQIVLNAALRDVGGAADYSLAGMNGRVEWTPGAAPGALNYRFRTSLDRADLADLGLPLRPDAALAVDAQGAAAKGGISGQAQVAGASVRYTVSPPKAGRRQIALSGSAPEETFARVGLDVREFMDGAIDFTGRLDQTNDGKLSGRLEADLSRAALSVPDSGWSKPMGRPARGYIDLAVQPGGGVSVQHIVAEGPGLEVNGSAALAADKASVSLPIARLDGFFDGALQAREGKDGVFADVDARYLDFRPILKRVQKASGAGGGEVSSQNLHLDAKVARVRLSESGYVKDVKLSAGWGAPAQRRATLIAATMSGSALGVKLYPDNAATALSVEVADLGDVARSLGGYANLRGGAATGVGRVVEGGYDFDFDVKNLTIIRVPGAAQLVATNGAIVFDEVVAPLKLRGSEVTLDDVRATGKSVGLTARGVMDTRTRTLDVVGVVTPAYVLNAALGGAFGARKTEGLFGITYTAKGPFEAPKITINPLSVAAPGFLRRMFEPRTPKAPQG
jgi:hypothetical protein